MYPRAPLMEARPVHPERTAAVLRARFERLSEDPDFKAILTFRDQVLFAWDFLEDDGETSERVTKTELAKFFNVQHSNTICAILKAGETGAVFKGRRSKLTDDEYAQIVDWVKEAAQASRPMTMGDVVGKVFRVFNKRVTKDSLRKGLKKRRMVKSIEALPMQACRLNLDHQDVLNFMAETERRLVNIPAAFLYNMDETGINEYANAVRKQVVVHSGFPGSQTRYPVPRDTSHATLVACIAADGTAIRPLVIVKHRTVRLTLMLMCWTDDKVRFRHSVSGYITHDLFIEWLTDTFIPDVDERRRKIGDMGQRAYLMLDNCSSHRSQDIIDLCEANNIELVFFVPNSTHIFQPLDLSFFSAFKAKLRSLSRKTLTNRRRGLTRSSSPGMMPRR